MTFCSPLFASRVVLSYAIVASVVPVVAQSAAKDSAATITAKTVGMRHADGLLPLDYDAKTGKLYLEIPRTGVELIYTTSLPYGTGSNDLGLDRGQISESRLVRFDRAGAKVLLVQENTSFRAVTEDRAEQLAVRQSFPESVLWGFKVETQTGDALLVDATEFFLHDAHGVAERLRSADQGSYELDANRSAIAEDGIKAFPRNTVVESILTFTGHDVSKAKFVNDVAPDAHAMTVRERQMFVALPDAGFVPRRFDPRSGFLNTTWRDYTAALGEPLDQNFVIRHRLEKKDPACRTDCEPVTPIQYYVDRGAPEPIRTALLEGARWWNDAFTAAGWKDAFRVDLLPADADPMDLRYNIIQWVHRYTRGWSYGTAVIDPRTGEILKGNVTLGSLRGRQDYLIAEALLSPYKDGKAPANDPMLQMVLARIRQLSAHETGHTLGLAHNFAASSFAQSASVMDYPHPLATIGTDGALDLSHAYASGIGAWDTVAIDYGYRAFPVSADEHAELNKILDKSIAQKMYFITDEDARPIGGAHPQAHLWDNGPDAAVELERVLDVRKVALARFGENAIRTGVPVAQLEDTLAPLYLFHRYQTEAAVKEIGGLNYRYALRGDGQVVTEIVPAAEQKKALAAVLKTVSPETLTLPESLLRILPPRPPALPRTRESLASHTGLTFDPVASAESAADQTFALLLNPQRTSRLLEYHARDASVPGLDDVLSATMTAIWRGPKESGLALEVQRAVQMRLLESLLSLAVNKSASAEVRAVTRSRVEMLKQMLASDAAGLRDGSEGAHRSAALNRIAEFERDPEKFVPAAEVTAPPGMPIGSDSDMDEE